MPNCSSTRSHLKETICQILCPLLTTAISYHECILPIKSVIPYLQYIPDGISIQWLICSYPAVHI
jgi:hypothetical protein